MLNFKGIFPAQESFQWLASWPAIICFGTASFFEILAYYIPFIDNLLDAITTPLAIGAVFFQDLHRDWLLQWSDNH